MTKQTTEISKETNPQLRTRQEFSEPTNFIELLEACKILVNSRIMPKEIDTPEKCAVVVLTGRELGLRMMASTRGIYIVNGRPALSAQMMLSLAYGTGELEDISIQEEGDAENSACTVVVKRKGKKAYTYRFSVAMAKKMQKYQNEWLKQPENMCKQRAISGNLRVTFPDAILGMYTPEEIQASETEVIPAPIEMPKVKSEAKPEVKEAVAPVAPEPVVYASEKHLKNLENLAKTAGIEGESYIDFLKEIGINAPDKINRQEYGIVMKKIAAIIDQKAKAAK